MVRSLNRRQMLATTGAGLTALVAGCSGGDDDDGGETHEVTVGPDGDLSFDPDSLSIDAGDTVEFVWDSDGHDIEVTDAPDDSDWDGVSDLQDEGYTHEHTFEVEGTYEYTCTPHDGMDGTITVD